jgi:molybdopterin adenylyltransferase
MTGTLATIGILTVSDHASNGTYEDLSGPAIERELARLLVTPWRPVRRLVPDEP